MTRWQDIVQEDLDYICRNLTDELPSLSGRTLLLTGGAGFLGYYLVQAILHWNRHWNRRSGADAIRLLVYDSYIRGLPAWLARLQTDGSLRCVQHDVTTPLPADLGTVQYIIHAASIASPTYYRLHPIETMDANVQGLRRLLEYCQTQRHSEARVKGLLFMSSSEIYGDPTPDNIPTPETYRGNVSCTGPRACYDESKRYGETLCVNFARTCELPVTMARPFNNYGPGLKLSDRRVLPDFVRNIIAGENIEIFSDGSSTRTFCYVADAVIGYFKILVKGQPGDAYNIGVEEPEISIGDLATRVAGLANELFAYQGRVVFQQSPDRDYLVDNPQRRRPLIGKARAALGYNPTIALDEGLRRALIWYHGSPDAR